MESFIIDVSSEVFEKLLHQSEGKCSVSELAGKYVELLTEEVAKSTTEDLASRTARKINRRPVYNDVYSRKVRDFLYAEDLTGYTPNEIDNSDILGKEFSVTDVRGLGTVMRSLGFRYLLKKSTGKRRWVRNTPLDISHPQVQKILDTCPED